MALEPAGDVERFQRQGIFRWQSQAWGFRSSLIRQLTRNDVSVFFIRQFVRFDRWIVFATDCNTLSHTSVA
jgi:hypothetical protein